MREERNQVAGYVHMRLEQWKDETNEHRVRADLANLRRGIGKRPGELPELWGLLFRDLPEELMSKNGEPSRAEWAISGALTLYALHQQGAKKGTNMNQKGRRLGLAVSQLVGDGNEDRLKAVQRRFNAFATARDMPECMHHLRGLIQLLRSEEIPLDYEELALNLYDFQNQKQAANIRLLWGEDFYRNLFRAKEGKDENHE